MTNQSKDFLALTFGIVLVGAISFYIYKDWHKITNLPLTQSENQSPKTQISIQTDKPEQSYKVETVPDATPGPKMPNMSLSVVNYSHIDNAAFEIVAKNIATLASELKKNPEDELKWLNLGILRKMLGDYQASVEILNYVAILWPTDYTPFNNLADLYQYYIKNYPLAEKNWLKVIELKPDYPEAYKSLYNLYKDPNNKEKEAKALPILLAGLENNPKSTELMVYIARHYRSLGDKDKAIIYYTKAIDEAKFEKNEQLESSLRSEAAEMSK
ncbi:MAG: tetratricopeptide repeat protein [Candidatus Taylorbacteria bacterium]|nr:tetratricopeptide repeat protein [Candidatus Taylorbacteria bacterium]